MANEALAALEEHFRVRFVEEGIEDTREHQAIVRAFCQSDSHLTADDLLARAREQGVETSLETVRDVMGHLCEYGLAREVKIGDGDILFEHLHLHEHHDHLICTRCRKVINFYDRRLEELKEAVATQRGFFPFSHRLEIYGLCSECLPEGVNVRALTEVAMGERVRVVRIEGGWGFVQRLTDLGLTPETEVQVLNNAGPIILGVANTRIALGRGMAARVFVK